MRYSVILTDSVYRSDKSYYPQPFLGECEYAVKKEMIKRLITVDWTDSDSDSDYGIQDEMNLIMKVIKFKFYLLDHSCNNKHFTYSTLLLQQSYQLLVW